MSRREPSEDWSARELIDEAIAQATRVEEDDDAYWAPIRLLRLRDPKAVWAVVHPLAAHDDPRVRSLVADVLGSLAAPELGLAAASVGLFRSMLGDSPPEVVASIGHALGELAGEGGFDMMLPYARHDDVRVRQGVVSAMLGQRDARAIAALVALSADDHPQIRDWATYGLASALGEPGDLVDGAELRDALAARVADPHASTRAEAVVGLAARRDPRALPCVLAALTADSFAMDYVKAARHLGERALEAPLRALLEDPGWAGEFEPDDVAEIRAALAACGAAGAAAN
jgi:HEAT repeat protein